MTSNTATESHSAAIESALQTQLEAGGLEIPMLDRVVSEVMAASLDPEMGTRDIALIVERDPVLSAEVIRLSNSSLYAPRVPIVSLGQAVNRLGMSRIREMALLIACRKDVFRCPGHEATVESEFHHALVTALMSQAIARNRKTNVEEAFMCGLIHDAGRLLILQQVVNIGAEINEPIDSTISSYLMDKYHEKAGCDLIRSWTFPERMMVAVRDHHSEDISSVSRPTLIIALANELAKCVSGDNRNSYECLPNSIEECSDRAREAAAALNIYPNEMNDLLQSLDDLVANASELS